MLDKLDDFICLLIGMLYVIVLASLAILIPVVTITVLRGGK